jgi:hypothetical protein
MTAQASPVEPQPMNTKQAIETLLSQATAYVETQAAGLRHRDEVVADTPDEKLAWWSDANTNERERYEQLRDYERAIGVAQAILEQRGCEHFDAACDGSLTDFIDIVIGT